MSVVHHLGLEDHLRSRRDEGKKLLVPYVTGGLDDEWLDVVRSLAAAGADAIEVGLPFSDPMIDGPVIQQASQQALERGATPHGIITDLAHVDVPIPIVVMTYANVVARTGYHRMAQRLSEVGIAGAIIPDLPLDEAAEWIGECAATDIASVLLVAPTTPDARLKAICETTKGFAYCVGLLGVTGERDVLSSSASVIASRVKKWTDTPALVGIGISNAEQAVQVCQESDGVIVGSALVRRLLEGGGPEAAAAFIGDIRTALDAQ